MDAREMHYDFKTKLNKIDSQKYRNLKVPEIDWKLNEAQELFPKIVAQPRIGKQLGFEVNQRTIDDIRTIVINQKFANAIVLQEFDSFDSSFIGSLPQDYWFFLNGQVLATKGKCIDKVLDTKEVQHDDNVHKSPFDKSSFLWRVANIRFIKEGIKVLTNKDFTPTKIRLDYLKKPRMIHNAQDWTNGTYNTVSGIALTGSQSCELPEPVHREIVDLAVFIAANDINLSNYQFKRDKLNLVDIKQ